MTHRESEITSPKACERAAFYLRPLLVLTGLAGIGWWGHISHWSLGNGASSGNISHASSHQPPMTTSDSDEIADDKPASLVVPASLPPIAFHSAAAAQQCGIECGTAESRPLKHFVTANGVIDYDQTRMAQLSARVSGVVWRVEKHLGNAVKAGEVLAIVDSAEIGQAKALLLETAVQHKFDVQTVERLEKSYDVVPHRDLLTAKAAEEASRTKRFNALQQLMALGLPLKADDIVSITTDELANRLRGLGLPTPYDIDAPSSNLAPLVAPFSGVVTRCDIVRGENVNSSKVQYVVADINRLWINLAIREEDVSKLSVGAPVEFASEREEAPITCTLTWIGTEIDPRTRTVKARAEGENPRIDRQQSDYESRRRFQVGTFGTARIITGDSPSSVAVPNDALHWQWEIGCEVVFVPSQEGLLFTPRVVTKGEVRGGFVQIVEGLSAGEAVVTSGSRILSSELSELLSQRLSHPAPPVREFN